jgi:solute carrier family 25 carnitine/acylcarnitine transporter 20/29
MAAVNGMLTLASEDIVKVRLQTTQNYTGALDAATKIYKNEGASAFYKGTLTPLIGIGACVSISFILRIMHS